MRRKRNPTHPAGGEPRIARQRYEEDPPKLPEPAACPDCGASYRSGRWTWDKATADAKPHVCPACERIASRYPAGVLRITGSRASRCRDEIVSLLRHVEERERARHPLKRIMEIREEGTGLVVPVTDAKLALGLGRALARAHAGHLEEPPTTRDKENLVRVHWSLD